MQRSTYLHYHRQLVLGGEVPWERVHIKWLLQFEMWDLIRFMPRFKVRAFQWCWITSNRAFRAIRQRLGPSMLTKPNLTRAVLRLRAYHELCRTLAVAPTRSFDRVGRECRMLRLA